MLFLVFADRDIVGLIQKDIGRHQRGISKEARVDIILVFI